MFERGVGHDQTFVTQNILDVEGAGMRYGDGRHRMPRATGRQGEGERQ